MKTIRVLSIVAISLCMAQPVKPQANRVEDDSWGPSTFGVRYALRVKTNSVKPGGDVLFYTQVRNLSSNSIVITEPANDHYYLTNNSGQHYELTRIASIRYATRLDLRPSVNPGAIWSFSADLTMGFDAQPGEYELTATRNITVASNTVVALVSNTVKLKVVDKSVEIVPEENSANNSAASTNFDNKPIMGF